MQPFRIVLVEPEIPSNAGSIARLCAATRSELHLVHPLGFRLDDAAMRRAGMDYLDLAAIREHREPLCNVHEGRQTVEMILGVFESQRQGRPVALPLTLRDRHPLVALRG